MRGEYMPGNHAIQKIRGEPRKQVDINPNIFMLPYNRGCMFQEKKQLITFIYVTAYKFNRS